MSNPDEVIKKIFSDEPEVYKANSWLAPNTMTGEEASLVIDLGCIKEINGVYLKNLHNAHKDNRGNRQSSVFVREKESQAWTRITTEPSDLRHTNSYTVNMVTTEQDYKFANNWFNLSSNFTKFGDPTPFMKSTGPTWRDVQQSERADIYLEINRDNRESTGMFAERMEF